MHNYWWLIECRPHTAEVESSNLSPPTISVKSKTYRRPLRNEGLNFCPEKVSVGKKTTACRRLNLHEVEDMGEDDFELAKIPLIKWVILYNINGVTGVSPHHKNLTPIPRGFDSSSKSRGVDQTTWARNSST